MMLKLESLFGDAVRHHRAGRLADAERCCRSILAIDGRHADSLHLLGMIAGQIGRHGEAIDLMGQAIRFRNDVPAYHINLGNVLMGRGRLDEAATHYVRAIRLRPDIAEAHYNLGNAIKGQGKLAEAAAHYGRALSLRPEFAEAHNNLGNSLKGLGQPAAAATHYERAVSIRPDSVEAHDNLAGILMAQGDLAGAAAHYERAVALKPDHLQALNNLGNVLISLGRFADATIYYERAIALKPEFAEAHTNLGIAFSGQGRLDDAMACHERALALRPDFAEAHNNQGNILTDQRKLEQAVTRYRRALELKPDYADAHNNLGNALRHQDNFAEAAMHYERAIALKPDYAAAHTNLGNALASQGKLAAAAACHERALALKPEFAEAHHNLGNALVGLGKLRAAEQAYERAVLLNPKSGRNYRSLLSLKRVDAGDRHLAAMETLARDMPSLPAAEQMELHFALGKAYADLDQRERSFSHFLEGGAFRRRELGYDEARTLAGFDRLRDLFTHDFMGSRRGLGDPSSVPVFIIGMPRSGTTLVEQILASHPKVFGAGELREFSTAMGTLAPAPQTPASFAEFAAALPNEKLPELGAIYLNEVQAMAPWAARITDKMPGNFPFAGMIHLALPNARIVHVRRDPIDTCVSCFSMLFANGHPYSYDLAELGRYYRAYEAVMAHWRRVLPDGAMLEVRYEDVVADLETQARRVVSYCGLEWDDACLAFHATQRNVLTASATQVRRPIYRTSVGRWRPYEHLLRPLIAELFPGGQATSSD
jgi:tetratricopeptide (TPR) repeat protein